MDPVLEPLIKVQKELTPPEGRDFWTSPQEDGQPPIFNTREVASVFFGRSKIWLQMILIGSDNRLTVEIPDIPRRSQTSNQVRAPRQFQLHHVELIAHALFSTGIINLETFARCITIVKCIAQNYRLL